MSLLLFLIVLVALVVVHELGHFAVAKWAGIRVDEFGLGFPPKVWSRRIGETEYSVNALPFGGFVRIYGESIEDEVPAEDASRRFTAKTLSVQALVIAAGIIMNALFAWLLFSIGFMAGMPVPGDHPRAALVENFHTAVAAVAPDSPAERAGLLPGDEILAVRADGEGPETLSPEDIQAFIALHKDETILIQYAREEEQGEVRVETAEGIAPDRPVVGIIMEEVGILKLPPHLALIEGARLSIEAGKATVSGLSSFFAGLFTGRADFSDITGPVGLVGVVGDAAEFGFVPLLTLVALISLNLAVINLIPFPALDGGRLLFILIEAIKGSPIRPEFAHAVNMIGFALLILLMLFVTYHDIVRIAT